MAGWLTSVVISLQKESQHASNIGATAPKVTAGKRRGSFVPKHVTSFTSMFYGFCSVTGSSRAGMRGSRVVTLSTEGLVGGSSLDWLNTILHGISSICNTEVGVYPSLFQTRHVQIQNQYNIIKMTFYTSLVNLWKAGRRWQAAQVQPCPKPELASLDVRAGWKFAQQNHRWCWTNLGHGPCCLASRRWVKPLYSQPCKGTCVGGQAGTCRALL